jgi:hypothetical protein
MFAKSDGTFHDAQTFLDAASLLGQGVNPYTNPFFLNSYVLAIPFSKFISLFPSPIGPIIWNLINVLGIYILISYLTPAKSLPTRIWILTLVLAMSPSRAMFASVQHTGVILGLLSLSFNYGKKFLIQRGHRNLLIASSCLFLAFEFKPQFAVPLLAVFFFNRKGRIIFYLWFSGTVVLHGITSLYFKMPLDQLWMERLAGRSQSTAEVNVGENSLWIIPSSVFGHPNLWLVVGFISYLLGVIYLIRQTYINESEHRVFLLILLVPLSLTYVHTYDYLALAILIGILFYSHSSSNLVGLGALLFLVPTVATRSELYSNFAVSLALYLVFEAVRQLLGIKVQVRRILVAIAIASVYVSTFGLFSSENLRISVLLAVAAGLGILSLKIASINKLLSF